MNEPSDEKKREKKVSFGPAELRAVEEKGHYGLFRPLLIDAWDDQKGEFIRIETEKPVGPLAIFREVRGSEPVDMRTIHPQTQQELKLTCVWDPSHTFLKGREG